MKFKESKLYKKYTPTEVSQMIEEEYQIGYTAVVVKRQQFRLQDSLINAVIDTAANPYTRIDLKTITKFLEAQIALFFNDEISAKFVAAQMGGREISAKLTRAMKFDYKLMRKKQADYECQMNRITRGVGLQVMIGWDKVKNCPIFECVDTRQWIPDPFGWHDSTKFRFHGFETEIRKGALSEKMGYDMDMVWKEVASESPESILSRTQGNIYQGIMSTNSQMQLSKNKGNNNADMYHHYTRIDGDMYMISSLNVRQDIVRVEEIEPVYDSEKDDHNLIQFPVVPYYWFPIKYTPYGINMIDMTESQHRYLNEMANLRFIREKDSCLGPTLLINANSTKNATDFTTNPTPQRNIVAVNDVNNAVKELLLAPPDPSAGSFMEWLQQTAMDAVSLNNTSMGQQGPQEETLGQSQQTQAGENLKSMFKNSLNEEAEELYWSLWHRAYKQHLPESSKKIITVEGFMGSFDMEMKKSHFIFNQDPQIEIISTNTDRANREQQRVNLQPVLSIMLQDPTITPIRSTIIKRKILELNDVEIDEAEQLTGQSADELDAISIRKILDANIKKKDGSYEGVAIPPQGLMTQDHETYIAIFKQGVKTEANFWAIKARQEAIMEKNRIMQQQAQMQQGQENAQTQNSANPSGQPNTGGATTSPFNNPISNTLLSSQIAQANMSNNTPKNVITRANAKA